MHVFEQAYLLACFECYFLYWFLQKWSKGKSKDKLNYAVMFDQATLDKFMAEVPKMKLVTPYTICERLRINASLARRGIRELYSKGLIRPLGETHHSHYVFTKPAAASASA